MAWFRHRLRIMLNPDQNMTEKVAGNPWRTTVSVAVWGMTNLFSAVLIVVANKMVLSTYHFRFPV